MRTHYTTAGPEHSFVDKCVMWAMGIAAIACVLVVLFVPEVKS